MNKPLMILLVGCILLLAGCTDDTEKQVGDTTVVVVDGETSVAGNIDKDNVDASNIEDQPLINQNDSSNTIGKNSDSSMSEEEKKALLDDTLKDIENLKE